MIDSNNKWSWRSCLWTADLFVVLTFSLAFLHILGSCFRFADEIFSVCFTIWVFKERDKIYEPKLHQSLWVFVLQDLLLNFSPKWHLNLSGVFFSLCVDLNWIRSVQLPAALLTWSWVCRRERETEVRKRMRCRSWPSPQCTPLSSPSEHMLLGENHTDTLTNNSAVQEPYSSLK